MGIEFDRSRLHALCNLPRILPLEPLEVPRRLACSSSLSHPLGPTTDRLLDSQLK
jgi:hypothetical protein